MFGSGARADPAAPLARGEARRTGKRSDEALAAQLRLTGEPLVERSAEALERRPAVAEQGLLGEARETVGELQRPFDRVVDDLVDQPDRERLARVDHAAGHD